MSTATIFNIQRFSLNDGPGIRTTVFLKGCPLSCAWCHNPESMDPKPELMLKAEHCVACELCVPVCDHALTGKLMDAGHPDDRCTRCGECVEVCPAEARQMSGEEWSVQGLLAELGRDQVYHAESSGGVTFSGGEPLTAGNAPFVLSCLETLSQQGIHTAIDTCGHVSSDILLEAARLADLVLYDIKVMDLAGHIRSTGRNNRLILENLERLLEAGHKVWVRVPLIPGFTDDAQNLDALADYLLTLPRTPRVFLLPYHATGGDKYSRLGRTYEMQNTPSMTPEELTVHVNRMRARGLEVEG